MGERASRLLLAAQALGLMLPLTLLAGLLFAARAVRYAEGEPFGLSGFTPGSDAVLLACFVALGTAWWLVAKFVLRGRAGLARAGRLPRRIADVAALATATLGTVQLLSEAGLLRPHASGPAHAFAFGLPLLLPYAHLAIERRCARATDTTREPR